MLAVDSNLVSRPRVAVRAAPITSRANAWLAFAAMAVPAAVALLWLGRHLTFFYDELSFFTTDRPESLLEQWNSHWVTSLYVVLLGVDALVGHRYYAPFLAALVAFHVLAAAALYALLPRLALPLVAIFLVLGTAAEDLLWAWQIGFVGATAAGLLGLLALHRGHAAVAAIALLVGVTFSGMGLPFVAAAGVYALASRSRDVIWTLVPAAAFVAWRILFAGPSPDIGAADDVTVVSVATYTATFVADSVGTILGVGAVGAALLIGIAALAIAVRRQAISPLLAAAIVGLVAEFVIISAVRSGVPFYQRSRYLYPAAAFVFIAIAEIWPARPLYQRAIAPLLVLAFAWNAVLFVDGPERWAERRYQLPEAWGCIPLEVIPDGEGPHAVAPDMRC